jgi:hypothetical protein
VQVDLGVQRLPAAVRGIQSDLTFQKRRQKITIEAPLLWSRHAQCDCAHRRAFSARGYSLATRIDTTEELMKHTNRKADRTAIRHWMRYWPFARNAALFALAATALASAPSAAQTAVSSATELGIDAGATFGLGSQSSIDFTLPGTRFRMGFFHPGSRISIEPAAGFGYHKVEGSDGVFNYDLQLGALYHFSPITIIREGSGTTRITAPYVRPFIGFTGFSGGGSSDNEFSAGGGLGIKVPWRTDLAWRLEANLAYGFDNKAGRLGLLAGLSYFPR